MAKITGINTKLSGQIGDYLFRQTKFGTVVSEAPRVTVTRSRKQMDVRTQYTNLGAIYKLFDNTLKKGYEDLPAQMSVYNAFVQANLGKVKVYLPKMDAKNGGCVLAPYQITRGGLPSIAIEEIQVSGSTFQGCLRSSISLGGLEIDAQTTVAAFSAALIIANADWEEGDQLTFFYGQQTQDCGDGCAEGEHRADEGGAGRRK